MSDLNTRSVDDTKVTDHHALIITGITRRVVRGGIYRLHPDSRKDAGSILATLRERVFVHGMCLRGDGVPFPFFLHCQTGLARRVRRKEDREKGEPEGNGESAVFAGGENVLVTGHGLAQKKTLPRPLYTEATLLTAMETCGRHITDEQAKEAIKELGIGTPATRAAIITTLIKRDYIARSGKSIIPTEKGMYIYEAVKDMRVADVELTGSWEKALAQIERHTLDAETFMQLHQGLHQQGDR